MDKDDEDFLHLMEAIAKSEGLQVKNKGNVVPSYTPIFRHPLPVSEHKFYHERNLQRVMSCKREFQAVAAISQCDGWTLEEVYMKGGESVLGSKNGDSPLHLAVQMESIDCLLVLLNIGVDLNKPNALGFSPLQIAEAKGLTDISKLLRERGAHQQATVNDHAPDTTCLDVYPENKYLTSSQKPSMRNAYLLSKQTNYY
jgi:hypothetical protein